MSHRYRWRPICAELVYRRRWRHTSPRAQLAQDNRHSMSKLRSAIFYLGKPSYWPHFQQKLLKPFLPNLDTRAHRAKATRWARRRAMSLPGALAQLGIVTDRRAPLPAMSDQLMQRAIERARRSGCAMGGPGYIELIYAAARLTGARQAIETGVAYGWSSLALLAASIP